MLSDQAPAKVNLTLRVTGRRPDGYHLLDSLVVFAGAHDRLTASPSDTVSLTLGGPFAHGLTAGPENLVLRAARALAARGGVRQGAAIHLEKYLPVASGIGGGSSDAAAALRLLAELWNLDVPADALHMIAAELGADVPVCLQPAPRRMAGIGEILSPAPAIPDCGMVLVNPGLPVSTQSVFGARAGPFSPAAILPAGWPDVARMASELARVGNDLETPAVALCPEVGEVLATLRAVPGCLLARMSGSGASCFALFATAEEAGQAARGLGRPGWWRWGGGLWGAPPLYERADGPL